MAFSIQVIVVALLALSAHQASAQTVAAEYYEFSEGQVNPLSVKAKSTGTGNKLGDLEISGGVEWIGDKRKGIQFNGTSQLQTPNPFKAFMVGNDDGITLELWLELEDTASYTYTILTNRNEDDVYQKETCSKGFFALEVKRESGTITAQMIVRTMYETTCTTDTELSPKAVVGGVQSEPLHIIVTMDRYKNDPVKNKYEVDFVVHAGFSENPLKKSSSRTYLARTYYSAHPEPGVSNTGNHWYEMFGSSDPLSIGIKAKRIDLAIIDTKTAFNGNILALGLYDGVLKNTEIEELHTKGPPNSRPQQPTEFTQEVGEDAIEKVLVCDSNANLDRVIVDGSTICTDVDQNSDALTIVIRSLPDGCGAQKLNGACGILLDSEKCMVPGSCDVEKDSSRALTIGETVKVGNLFYAANPNDHSYTFTIKKQANVEYDIEKNVYASFEYYLNDSSGASSLVGEAKFQVRPAVDEPISGGQEIDIYSGQTKKIKLNGTHLDSKQPGAEKLTTYTRAFISEQPSSGKLMDSNEDPLKGPDPPFADTYPDLTMHPCYTTTSCLEINLDNILQYEADKETMVASGRENILTDTFKFFIESRSPNSNATLTTSVSTNPGTITLTHKNPLEVGGRVDVEEDRPSQQLKLRDVTRMMGVEITVGSSYNILSVPDKGYIYQEDPSNKTAYITEKEVDGGVAVEALSGFLEFQHWDLENEYNCGPSDQNCKCTSAYCTAEDNFTSFTVQAVDKFGFKSAPGTVYVNVKPYNDDPTLNVDSLKKLEVPAVPNEKTDWNGNITLFDDFDPRDDGEIYTTTIDMGDSREECLVSIARDWRSKDGRLLDQPEGDGYTDELIVITSDRSYAQEYLQHLVFTVTEEVTGNNVESRCGVTVNVKDGNGGEAEKSFDMIVISSKQLIGDYKNKVQANLALVYGIWAGAGLFISMFVGIIFCKIRDQCKSRKKADDNINPYLHAT